MTAHGIVIRPDRYGKCGPLSNPTDPCNLTTLPSSRWPWPALDRPVQSCSARQDNLPISNQAQPCSSRPRQ